MTKKKTKCIFWKAVNLPMYETIKKQIDCIVSLFDCFFLHVYQLIADSYWSGNKTKCNPKKKKQCILIMSIQSQRKMCIQWNFFQNS